MKGTSLADAPSTGFRIPKNVQQVKENVNKPAETHTVKTEEDANEVVAGISNQPFTLEQLMVHWNTFAAGLIAKGLSNEHMVIHNKELTLTPDFVIHLSVAHDVQMDQLEGIKIDLLTHLRHALKNRAIRLNATVSFVASKERKVFTDEDKFKHLAENYPVVDDLKRKLGLEINY